MKIGLISRCKDEYFIGEFVNYYLDQGVDSIYIIDDNSIDKTIYDNLLSITEVKILFEKDIINNDIANKTYKAIKHQFDWMIYVDVDEFITTKKAPQKTIRQELLSSFKNVHCVKVPWVMMSCNGLKKSPGSILETNKYRWNHDLKHDNEVTSALKFQCRYDKIEVKCIFKPKYFAGLLDHHPINPIKNKEIIITDSIRHNPAELDEYYVGLRESDIQAGYMLCYHYRIISVENCKQKLKNNKWYIDNGYSLEDLMSNDYPELIDLTLFNKTNKTVNK